jgi:hypothetical protein
MGLTLATAIALGGCFGLRASDVGDDAGDDARSNDATGGNDANGTGDASMEQSAPPDADSSTPDAPEVADAPDADVVVPCNPATSADFYVDPASTGSCTYHTITLAAAAARASSATLRTIHVAAGTYTTASGESFPIDLRGGISLVGAGTAAGTGTLIQGAGLAADGTPPTNAHSNLSKVPSVSALLLVGDATRSARIADVALQPPGGTPDGMEAILCDRGSAGPVARPPNTLVDGVDIQGFEIGVRVTWSSTPMAGCNALILASTVRDGMYGVVADGNGQLDASQNPLQFVSVQIGNGSASGGNSFLNLSIRDSSHPNYFNGAGFAACEAVNNAVVKGNRFAQVSGGSGDHGFLAVRNPPYYTGPVFDIEGNEFGPLGNDGVSLWGNITVDRLVGNSFHDISTPSIAYWMGTGLAMTSAFTSPPQMPALKYVRGNAFTRNDVGMVINAQGVNLDSSLGYDFGTAMDPGNNTFRCNTVGANGPDGPGGDILFLWYQQQTPPLTLSMEGNTWDHSPPTRWVSAIGPGVLLPPIGIDLFLTGTMISSTGTAPLMSADADTANASASTMPPCPVGRPAGP